MNTNLRELEILQAFLLNLSKKHHEIRTKLIAYEQTTLKNFFCGLLEKENQKQLYIKENAPYFNIFTILRYTDYETRLHTPFLVHLLNPDEHHQLGPIFFELLMKEIFDKSFSFKEVRELKIQEELSLERSLGRIDIFIKFRYKDHYRFVAIENKINAYDQEKQLERYQEFLESLSEKSDNIRLVYLTKNGREPDIPYSIEKLVYFNLLSKGNLKLLSYRNDISTWIKLLLEIKIPNSVKETITQYLNIIKDF